MTGQGNSPGKRGPGMVEHAISALNAWFGDYLSQTDNGLQQPMEFRRDNRPVAPEDLAPPPTGKVCVLVHGLGCNESLWSFPTPHEGGGYGELLERQCGYMPLYLRFNTGLRVSNNGEQLAGLLERFCARHDAAVTQLLLIGHSMGGLVIRSACHLGSEAGQDWVSRVRHVVYLGSPHLGAPLEKATNVATHLLGLFDTTATRVIHDVLNTRSAGVKDLRFGNLVDQDWLDCDPDELMNDRRIPIPWLATARHHLAVGQALTGVGTFGDAVVWPDSAAGRAHGRQPGAPGGSDVQVMPGLDHLALARHPAVYEHIERWVKEMDAEGPRKNRSVEFARNCATDLACPIERNPRCSLSYIEGFATEGESKMGCRGDAKTGSCLFAGPKTWGRLTGFKRLIHDGVKRGADLVEKHHRHAAEMPFRLLESIKPIAVPTKAVRSIHDGVLSLTYGSLRAINQAAEMTSDWVVDRLAPPDDGDRREPAGAAGDNTEHENGTGAG